jgi:alpha-tubulin suppressor-like RCC1 family protein
LKLRFLAGFAHCTSFLARVITCLALVTPSLAAPPVLLTPNLLDGQLGKSYSGGLLFATNPQPQSIVLSGLPNGLAYALNGKGATLITGTPLIAGQFDIEAVASNSDGETASYKTSLVVRDPTLSAYGATNVAIGTANCAIVAGGLQCWGRNSSGQLGDGTTLDRISPVRTIAAGSRVTSVSVGLWHSCAVVDGGLLCWGDNQRGRLGVVAAVPRGTVLQVFPPGSGVSGVAAGGDFSCAVVNSELQCWGNYPESPAPFTTSQLTPSIVAGVGKGVTAVAATDSSTCAVVAGGVKCWGFINRALLNDYLSSNRIAMLQAIEAGAGIEAIALSTQHICLLKNGGVICWGNNREGQLGDGTYAQPLGPVQAIAEGSGVTAIAVGRLHSCAVAAGGMRCWGKHDFTRVANGQFAPLAVGQSNGQLLNSNVPVSIFDVGAGVTQVALNNDYSCVVVAGMVRCWGLGFEGTDFQFYGGQLAPLRDRPALVVSASASALGARYIAAAGAHTCATFDTATKCWGYNYFGQLGDGTEQHRDTPTQSSGLEVGTSALAAGYGHSCAIVNGGIRCWGANDSGQLGAGKIANQKMPKEIFAAASGATAIAAGTTHTCAVVAGGVKCWGTNARSIYLGLVTDINENEYGGQLGDGTARSSDTPVQAILADSAVTQIAAGSSHSCAMMNGGVQCWGANSYGELGDGTVIRKLRPTQIIPIESGVTAIAAGNGRSCVVRNGGLQCWGGNYGWLGDGTKTNALRPTQILPAQSGVTDIALGISHGCAVVAGGVKCWGQNTKGQVGDGSLIDRSTPVDVIPSGAGVTAVALGNTHSCVVVNENIVCWGSNSVGQLAQPLIEIEKPRQILFLAPRPKAINFGVRNEVELNTTVVSEPQTIDGLESSYPISVVGGSYLIGCTGANRFTGTYTNAPNVIANNQRVCVKLVSSINHNESRQLILTVGVSNGILTDATTGSFTLNTAVRTAVSRIRIYVPETKGHLLLTNISEAIKLTSPLNNRYLDEGIDHLAYGLPTTRSGVATMPHYRLLNLQTGRYVWTGNANEYAQLRTQVGTYKDEGVDVHIFPTSGVPNTVPLYRIRYAPLDILHWTADSNEVQYLLKHGWNAFGETQDSAGVVGYVWPSNLGRVP